MRINCECDHQWMALCKDFLHSCSVTVEEGAASDSVYARTQRVSGVQATVVVLVRPDGHIQWLHADHGGYDCAISGVTSRVEPADADTESSSAFCIRLLWTALTSYIPSRST